MRLARFNLYAHHTKAHIIFRWGRIIEGGAIASVLPSFSTTDPSLDEYTALRPWIQDVYLRGIDRPLDCIELDAIAQESKQKLPAPWEIESILINLSLGG